MWRLSPSLTTALPIAPSTTLCCVSVLIVLPLFFFCPFVSPLLFLFFVVLCLPSPKTLLHIEETTLGYVRRFDMISLVVRIFILQP